MDINTRKMLIGGQSKMKKALSKWKHQLTMTIHIK